MACKPDCRIRKGLEAEQLPGPTPAKVCEAAAAALVLDGVRLGPCPLEQVDLGEEG